MPVEELQAKRRFLDSNDTLVLGFFFGLWIHQAVDDLALALTGIDVFIHSLSCGVDGH